MRLKAEVSFIIALIALVFALVGLLMFLSGCAVGIATDKATPVTLPVALTEPGSTTRQAQALSFERRVVFVTFLKDIKIPYLEAKTPDGFSLKVKGYESDAEQLGEILGTALGKAVKEAAK